LIENRELAVKIAENARTYYESFIMPDENVRKIFIPEE